MSELFKKLRNYHFEGPIFRSPRERRYVSNRKVTVNVSRLIGHLGEHKDQHLDIYNKALQLYRVAVMEAIEEGITSLQNLSTRVEVENLGRDNPVYLDADFPEAPTPWPTNYLSDYDDAIALFVQDEKVSDGPGWVELTQEEFQMFWLDKWPWSRRWLKSMQPYVPEVLAQLRKL